VSRLDEFGLADLDINEDGNNDGDEFVPLSLAGKVGFTLRLWSGALG
jgi:hypothetical protein